MAEVTIELKVMDLFTPDDYERLKLRARRHAQSLYLQSDGIRMVRESSDSYHIERLYINTYSGKTLPPYLLVLKDIEHAINNYKPAGQKTHDQGQSNTSARAVGQ